MSGRQTPALLPDTCTLVGKVTGKGRRRPGHRGSAGPDRPPPRGRPVISSHTQWRGAVHAAGPEGAAVANTAGLPSHSLRALEAQARDPRWVGHSHSSAPKGAYHLWNSRATLGRHLRDPRQGRGLRRVRPEAPCRPSRPADPGPRRAGCRPGFLPAPRWTPASPHAPPVRAERGARGAEPLRSAVQALSAGGGSQGTALALTAAPLGTPRARTWAWPARRLHRKCSRRSRPAAGRQSWAGRANRPEPDAPGAFHGGGGGRSAPSAALRGTAQQHPVPEPLLSPVVGQLSAPLA